MTKTATSNSSTEQKSISQLLIDPVRHPLRASVFASKLGRVAVAAPHPDDESLGCGGLLALLATAGQAADVLILTDGSRSHPDSRSYPAAQLAALREQETLSALAALGLPSGAAHFLRFGDCALPKEGTSEFTGACRRLHKILEDIAPDTLLVPWRRDPHCDHEATWRLLRGAAAQLASAPHWLEYPIWAWEHAAEDAAPRAGEAVAWRLDISPVLARKQQAIAQHRSQMGAIIRDDPTGFVLQPEMLRHFAHSWELYLEPGDV